MHFLTPSLLSGDREVQQALLTPSLLCGNWEVQHVLFDRISNTVSSCLVHFMIILVVFLRWMETLRDHFVMSCINFQVEIFTA